MLSNSVGRISYADIKMSMIIAILKWDVPIFTCVFFTFN